MLSYSRAKVEALNNRAREVRKSYNKLGIEASCTTEQGKRGFAINDRELGVKNGTLGTITSLYSYIFEVELDKFDIRDYSSIDHGYATTIHKSQSITVGKAFVLPCKYMNGHSTYVALNRHRESINIH